MRDGDRRSVGLAEALTARGQLVSARERSLQRERAWTMRLERSFMAAGLLGLLLCLVAASQFAQASRLAGRIVVGSAAIARPALDTNPNTNSNANANTNLTGSGAILSAITGAEPAVVGRIEIPALGLATPLLAGDDSMSLTEGAGHIPGTAYPGGLGTVGIAGHRDTHFRLLKNVARGMDVRLVDHTGTYHYRVTSSEIVTPEQVSVLDILSRPGLALVTCYPFHYVGSAPKRFVVHAALISVAPDEPAPAAR